MEATYQLKRAYAEVMGRQLHYRIAGNPDHPPVLLLHQSPSHSAMYELLMAGLSEDFYLLAPDTPGFGASDPLPTGDVSIARYAAVMKDFLEVLGISSCYLFGHHTGAGIAVQLEFDFPGTARAMALSGPPLLDEVLREALPAMAAPFERQSDGGHLLRMWERIYQKDPQAPHALLEREVLSALSSGEAYHASYSAVAQQAFAEQLLSIACRVLVYAGDEDPLYQAVAPTVALLEKGESVSLPGGERTYVCERQAPLVAGLLSEFFQANVESEHES